MITSRAFFLRTALSAVMLLVVQPVQAEVISSDNLPYKRVADSSDTIRVTSDLIVNSSSDDSRQTALITINARSGGIQIDEDIILDAHPGPYNPSDPAKGSIFIDRSGNLEGTLENKGHIRDGIFIVGNSSHQTGRAFRSEGEDGNNRASVMGGYTVINGGVSNALNADTVLIAEHSYMDFVVVGQNSSIKSSGIGKSALYVSANGQLGGNFDDTTPIVGGSTPTLEISRAESDTVIEIAGNMASSEGRGITIAGTATGRLHITSTGVLAGEGGGRDGAALVIDGTYTGTHLNEGSIQNGIFTTGTHTSNSGAAFHARGNSTLTGGYGTVNGGISESVNDYAVHLEGNSKTDFIVATGSKDGGGNSQVRTLAANKSAVYVANGAQLGGIGETDADDAAILVKDGGIIGAYTSSGGNLTPSLTSSAITVAGDFVGKVEVNNGSIITGESSYAVNFSNSNNPLNFEQTGENAVTQGIISGSSQHKSDTVAFYGGTFRGDTIQNIDHLVVSTSIQGITINNDFTLPTKTTVELTRQQDYVLDDNNNKVLLQNDDGTPKYVINTKPLMTVNGRLRAEVSGSNIEFKPKSTNEYALVKQGVTITLVDPDGMDSVGSNVTVDSGSFLINAEKDTSQGKLQVKLKSRDASGVSTLVRSSGASARAAAVFGNAATVVNASGLKDQTKGEAIFAKLNTRDYDVKKLAHEVQPRVAGEIQTSLQTVANTSHNIVFNRIHGLRRGISYGDQFVDGSAWGQLLYTSGEQNDTDGESGFKNQNWGITLGADAELDPSVRLGLAASLVWGSVNGNEGSSNTSYGYLATLYSSWNQRGYFIDTMVSMGNAVNDMKKWVDSQRVTANFGVDQWGFRMVGGKSWRIGNWNMSPQVEFNYGMVKPEEYNEKGSSGFEQNIKSSDFITTELGAGMKFDGDLWIRRGVIKPELTVMGYYDFITKGSEVRSTYLAGGDTVTVTGPDRDKMRLHLGLGLGVQLNNRWSFRGGYSYNWKKNYQAHSLSARARYEF